MGRGIVLGLLALLPAAVAGCNSARYVVQQPDGGIVAIPSNTNMWPFKHRDSAEELIRQHVGPNFEIIDQRQIVTGSTTTNVEQTHRDPIYNKKLPNVPGERETTTGTLTTSQNTEWQITYRRKFGPVVADQPSGGKPPGVSPASSVVPSIAPPVLENRISENRNPN